MDLEHALDVTQDRPYRRVEIEIVRRSIELSLCRYEGIRSLPNGLAGLSYVCCLLHALTIPFRSFRPELGIATAAILMPCGSSILCTVRWADARGGSVRIDDPNGNASAFVGGAIERQDDCLTGGKSREWRAR